MTSAHKGFWYRKVPIVASPLSELAAFAARYFPGGRYFQGVVIFGEQKPWNKASASSFFRNEK